MRQSYTEIEYPERYRQATEERIKANRRKGQRARWLAEDPSREALITAMNAMFNTGRGGSFLGKMLESLTEWGSLTAGQEAAVRRMLGEADARAAQWAAKRAEEHAADVAGSQFVGTVGERRVFTVKVEKIFEFETMYGPSFRHIMHDAAGNVITYKGGSRLAEKGETVTFKATVKEHSVYKDVNQTVVARPAKDKPPTRTETAEEFEARVQRAGYSGGLCGVEAMVRAQARGPSTVTDPVEPAWRRDPNDPGNLDALGAVFGRRV